MADVHATPRRSLIFLRSFALAAAIGLLSAVLAHGVLQPLELFAGDVLFRLRGAISTPSDVVMVAIDDASFAQNNLQWPWPRSYLARIVDNIAAGEPTAIAIDVQFYEPATPEEDGELVRAIREAGNVVLVKDISMEQRQGLALRQLNQPIPMLQEAAAAVGLAQFQRDEDGTLRRNLALGTHNGEMHYSMSMQLARLHLSVDEFHTASPDEVWIGGHRVELSELYLLVDFRGPAETTIPYYSAYQVADRFVDPQVFEGKIVIVGPTAETIPLYDSYTTPFGSSPLMPGAEVNAHAVDTILNSRYVHAASPLARIFVPILAALITMVIVVRLRPIHGLLVLLLVEVAVALGAYLLFTELRMIVPLLGPALATGLTFVVGASVQLYEEQRQRVRIRTLFERYVSPAAIDEMLTRPERVTVGGQRREVTVLFSDIRGFTALSEKLRPEEVVAILNDYLGVMTEVIFKHRGTVDKFEGDGILAIWNAPLPVEDHATRAVECAIEMTQKLAEMQKSWAATGQRVLQNGTGINTGECFVGNIGSEMRMEYTVIGDVVNLAARLEGLSKDLGLQIAYTQSTHDRLGEAITSRYVTSARVVGREQPVQIYTVDPAAHGVETVEGADLEDVPGEFVQTVKR